MNTPLEQPEKRTKRRKRSRLMAPNKLIVIPFSVTDSSTSRAAQYFYRLIKQNDKSETKKTDYSPVVVYISHENYLGHDRLSLVLRIDDNTTIQDLRDAAPLVLAMRDRLLEFQGPRDTGGSVLFFEHLCRDKAEGESWAKLAKRINSKVAELLQEWANYLIEYQEVAPRFKKFDDFFLWKSHADRFALERARDLMQLMKIPDPEIETIINDALEEINRGEPPFVDGYPIDADELRSTLRSWMSGKAHRFAKRNPSFDYDNNRPH
jgi:hypothetical protein